MVKNRIFYYDFLRTFAIVAVIMCHVDPFFGVWHNTTLNFVFHSIFHGIGLIGVPIFLMISGALLLNKEYTLSNFLKKRFSRIFYPCMLWMMIILSIGLFYFKWDTQFSFNVFIGNGSIMWYFWLLIGIYLFLPIINSFIKEYGLKGMEYFLIIWFVIIILRTFQMWPLFPPYELNMNFELNTFAGFIGYPILGYYLDNKKFKLNNKIMFLLGLIILLCSLFIYVYQDLNVISMGSLYLNLTNVFMAIGMFISVKYFDRLGYFYNVKNNLLGKLIISISICSYGMYFAHFIIIKFFEQFNFHSNKFIFFILLLIVGLSWVVTYVLSKIPYLKKFSGV